MSKLTISDNLKIMGVLNTTPDSFSDGGRFNTTDKAVEQARQLIADGADILDIGGESTRPGSRQVDLPEEIDRTIPLIRAIREFSEIPISIDTSKPGVMQAAVEAGASMINSIWALRLDNSMEIAAELGVPVCLMHMQGSPETMQKNPSYDDVVTEVRDFLAQHIEIAIQAGIDQKNIVIDPGFGFGKSIDHNLSLLKALGSFRELGVPVLAGLSRKSMIGTLLDKPVDQRLYGSLSVAVMAAMLGADILRVHDVSETNEAITMVKALKRVS
ncbi:MAG: dihydropteroate synthase [Pseudomonadota bacterium]